MRRRLPPEPAPAPDNLPERLRWCVVEDWVQPGEQVEEPEIRAYRRWRDARALWAAEHAVEVRSLRGGGGARWRRQVRDR